MVDKKKTFLQEFLFKLQILLVGIAGGSFLRLVESTLRWTYVGFDGEKAAFAAQEPSILAFWHGHQLMMSKVYRRSRRQHRGKPAFVLISQHRDGRFIASIMKFLKIGSVTGSSSQGGREAMNELIRVIRAGNHAVITPDGPKGPKHEVKAGVVRIAQQTGGPIRPLAVAAQRKWVFRSWDGMFLPKPFSRIVVVLGDPIFVRDGLSSDEFDAERQRVKVALDDATARAESLVGNTRATTCGPSSIS